MPKDVGIYYQPKAWFDTPTSMEFAKRFNKQTRAVGEKLLRLDNLGSQCAPEFKKLIRDENTLTKDSEKQSRIV